MADLNDSLVGLSTTNISKLKVCSAGLNCNSNFTNQNHISLNKLCGRTLWYNVLLSQVPDLKKELKNRGLSTSGNKNDLVERLQAALHASEENPVNSTDSIIDDIEEDLLNVSSIIVICEWVIVDM